MSLDRKLRKRIPINYTSEKKDETRLEKQREGVRRIKKKPISNIKQNLKQEASILSRFIENVNKLKKLHDGKNKRPTKSRKLRSSFRQAEKQPEQPKKSQQILISTLFEPKLKGFQRYVPETVENKDLAYEESTQLNQAREEYGIQKTPYIFSDSWDEMQDFTNKETDRKFQRPKQKIQRIKLAENEGEIAQENRKEQEHRE